MPPPGYQLVFDEEFNGRKLEVATGKGWGPIVTPIKWTAHTPYAGDFGAAYFTGPSENGTTPDPFSISNGILTIQAYKDPTINNHWRSGLLSSASSTATDSAKLWATGNAECSFHPGLAYGLRSGWPA